MPPNCPTCGRPMTVPPYSGWGSGMPGPPHCFPCLAKLAQVVEDALAAKRAKRAKRSSVLPDFPPSLADNEDCDGPAAGEAP